MKYFSPQFLGTIDSQTPSSDGAVVLGNGLYLQSASVTVPGLVNNTTQSFSGNKTFTGTLTINGFTQGSIIFAGSSGRLTQDNANFYWNDSAISLGIGTQPAANTILDVVANTTSAPQVEQLTGYGANTIGLRVRHARGTSSSPSGLLTGDILGFFGVRGYGTTQFPALNTASITMNAAENFTDTANGTYTVFNTTPIGSVTLAERMRISPPGNLLIGTTTDNGIDKLQVNGTINASGATLTSLTQNSVLFSGGSGVISQDNSLFNWNDTLQTLNVGNNTANPVLNVTTARTSSTAGAVINGQFSRGTIASPTQVLAGDLVFSLDAQPYGTSYNPGLSGSIAFIATENTTSTNMGGQIVIAPTANGTVVPVAQVTVASTGITLGTNTSIHSIVGSIKYTTRTITANLTVDTTTTDYIILCKNSGAITVTLPTPTNGRILIIKDINGAANTNNITIARHASEKIENIAASYILQTNFGSITLTSDGTNWWMI